MTEENLYDDVERNQLIEREMNLSDMANFRVGDYSLPVNILLSIGEGLQHEPRVKVQKDYSTSFKQTESFSITVPRNSGDYTIIGETGKIKRQDIDTVVSFVKRNKEVILDLWDNKMSNIELVQKLK